MSIKSTRKNLMILVISFFFLSSSTNILAQGNLQLFPKRIVFEGSRHIQTINLANSGKDSARYLISIIQSRMNEDGKLEVITQPDSGQLFADPYFRYFPREVLLAPNESQTVKIQLFNAEQMEPGEYRSHLYFRAETNMHPLGEETVDPNPKNLSVKLTPVFGVTIPVIIRKGDITSEIIISNICMEKNASEEYNLKLSFIRMGSSSVYGDISVEYFSIAGKSIRLLTLKGIAIYTPNRNRQFILQLPKMKDVDYKEGSIHVKYVTQHNKPVLMAEEELRL